MNNNIDEILDQLDGFEKITPSEEFLEKLEKKALSFTELRIRYGKKMVIGILILIAGIFIVNVINLKYQNSNNTEEIKQTKEYDMVPANTVNYE